MSTGSEQDEPALILVTHDAPRPVINGGRARLVGLEQVLAELGPVEVLVPRNAHHPVEVADGAVALPECGRSKVGSLLSARPRLGQGLVDAAVAADVAARARSAAAVVVSHSFVAACLPSIQGRLVVDFPNLEVRRQASLGSALGRVESIKARRWEPRVALAADLCVAVDEEDAKELRRWGATRVVVMPNAAGVSDAGPSPDVGYALAVADWDYAPNRQTAETLRALGVPLVLVGRGSERWPEGRGFIDDLGPVYAEAAVVVAPAVTGGGTQLKIVEAACRGRVVVTNDYGARSLPREARTSCFVGDIGEGIRQLLADVEDRHRREAALRQAALPRSWSDVGGPLRQALKSMLTGVGA